MSLEPKWSVAEGAQEVVQIVGAVASSVVSESQSLIRAALGLAQERHNYASEGFLSRDIASRSMSRSTR